MSEHLVIAIDGPAGSGKSTVARQVAERLGYTLLDTGALYRAIGFKAREMGVVEAAQLGELAQDVRIEFKQVDGDSRVLLDGRDVSEAIRTPEISAAASDVSKVPAVRQALLGLQRGFAERGPLVAEGRDMGTVVFPSAQVKVFLDAKPAVRARRRTDQLRKAGHQVRYDEVLAAEEARDAQDTQRAVAPLRAAADAFRIDTDKLTIDEVVERIIGLAGGAGAEKRG